MRRAANLTASSHRTPRWPGSRLSLRPPAAMSPVAFSGWRFRRSSLAWDLCSPVARRHRRTPIRRRRTASKGCSHHTSDAWSAGQTKSQKTDHSRKLDATASPGHSSVLCRRTGSVWAWTGNSSTYTRGYPLRRRRRSIHKTFHVTAVIASEPASFTTSFAQE